MVTAATARENVRCPKCRKLWQAWAFDNHKWRRRKPKPPPRKCRSCRCMVSAKKWTAHKTKDRPARFTQCSCGQSFVKDGYNWCPKCRQLGDEKRKRGPVVQGGLPSLGKKR